MKNNEATSMLLNPQTIRDKKDTSDKTQKSIPTDILQCFFLAKNVQVL